jgi:hypothetical protein
MQVMTGMGCPAEIGQSFLPPCGLGGKSGQIGLPNSAWPDVDEKIAARLSKPGMTHRHHRREEILAPSLRRLPQRPADVIRNHLWMPR